MGHHKGAPNTHVVGKMWLAVSQKWNKK